ncbi:hypothetical protein SORBI_3009G133300 [Sorghum bicolor]|uniref:Uncharacterized protein n=1 Tax=Sorghum bicolor TaxID=4558 RepID=A0A1Z5R2H4_SORBI|nr:hypothetical protein SORBI_3009G133300 [Sorghum bicolor]
MQQRRSGPPSQSTPNSSGLAPRAPIQSYGTPRRATPTMASSWQSTSCSAWRRRTSSRSPPPRPCTAGRTAPWAPPHPWTTGLDPGSGRAVGIHDLVAWIHDPTRSMTWWPRSALQCSPAPYHFPPPHYRIPSLLVPCRQQAVLGSNGIPARPHLHTVPPLPTSAPGTGSGQQRGGQLRLRAAARACGRAYVAACRCGTQVHAARARPSGVVPLQAHEQAATGRLP